MRRWHLIFQHQIRKVTRRGCFLVFSALTITVVLYFLSIWKNQSNGSVLPGYARKSWGSADQVKVFVDDVNARKLHSSIKILCLVLTMKKSQESLALAVNQTWGRRCSKLLFVTLESLGDMPHIVLNETKGRDHLSAKTFAMFKYAYRHHLHDFDWFLKADDDTYFIMENLRFLLSFHDPSQSIYLGHHFKRYVNQGYMSGGAGYVISRQALRTFGERSQLCVSDGWEEDVDFGKCMSAIGVPTYDSKDKLSRNSFHPPHYSDDLYWMGYVEQHAKQVKGPIHIGPSCCSQLSISFHKLSPQLMYLMEFLLYRMTVFGRHMPDQLFHKFFQQKMVPHVEEDEDIIPHFD